MILDSVNLNHLKIFASVYRTKSMTIAAQELHLTQSGVSQHMTSLELSLRVRLFDRVKQRLVPTAAAGALYQRCVEGFSGIEATLSELRGEEPTLSGVVSVGMPIEFGNNVIVPLLSEFGAKHPRVRFALRYGFATEMNQGLLSGDLDFAFVDAFALDRRTDVEKVYDEELYLCTTKSERSARESREFFESLPYVDYQTGEPVLRMWFRHHLGPKPLRLNVRATVMDVQGVARFILSGLAAGVLPGHLIAKLENEGHKLQRFKGCGKPLKNSISVAYLTERTHGPASTALFKWLKSRLLC